VANCPQHLVATDNQDPEEVLESVAYHSDGQCADTGVFAYYQLAQAVRRTTTVALSGDGGDEFFGGYSTYTATRFASRLVLPSVRPYVERAGLALYSMFPGAESRMPRTALFARLLLGIGAGDAPPHLQWRRLVPRPLLVSLYGPRMAGLIRKTPFAAYQAAFDDEDGDLLDKALIADQRYHIQSVLMKVDLMSMAHGLEVRVPLLDRRIMDVAGRISLGLLMPLRGPRKFVLRSLAARLGAPPEVTTGKKKGFNVPLAALMRGPLARVGNRLLDRDADILAPFISPDGLRHLWRMHRDVKANHAFALWPLFVLAAYWSNGHRRTSITSTVAASPA
jgi:asparagine synthase (glutamine-hydrolysing)